MAEGNVTEMNDARLERGLAPAYSDPPLVWNVLTPAERIAHVGALGGDAIEALTTESAQADLLDMVTRYVDTVIAPWERSLTADELDELTRAAVVGVVNWLRGEHL